jgi:hypothetical protein
MRILQVLIIVLALALGGVIAIALGDDSGNQNASSRAIVLPPITPGGTPLQAGDYTTSKFLPETTFALDRGWATASPEIDDYFDVIRQQAFKAISFERVQTVATTRDPSGTTPAPAPKRLLHWVRTHPHLRTGTPQQTNVNGVPAVRLDAKVTSATAKPKSCEAKCVPLFIPSDGTPVSYQPGDMLRFIFLTAGGGPLTITIAARANDFRSFLPQAKKVLQTVQFGS